MTAVKFIWEDSEKTLLRIECNLGWTWNEYHAGIEKIQEELTTLNHAISLMTVYHPGARLPSGSPMPHLARLHRLVNVKHLFIVTYDPVNKRLLSAFSKPLGFTEHRSMWFFDTITEARRFAEQQLGFQYHRN